MNLENIESDLEGLRKARQDGLPIAGWRRNALKLFKTLHNRNNEGKPYKTAKSLSKRLAFDCRTELEKYFISFGFNDEGEKGKWQELSNHLRMIYSS